ncbi:SBBP repeat-containing protein [Saccharicrinis sp. GN24d3]|uniref:SBBP repeat-containing protein n=1 Tax=Saccharicrinis sp. GN24d3 TaxID=3458416 RepID=UPI0040361F68
MQKSKIILVIVVFLCNIGHAQDTQKIWHWMEQLGGPGWDFPNGIAIDSKDNIYIAGGFTETLQGGRKGLKSEGNRDVYVARFNDKGKLQWLWQAGGEKADKITAIKAAPNNDMYIAGMLEGEMKFGKQKLEYAGKQLFVSRINKRGKSDWVYTLPYSGAASGYLLDTDKHGNIILGGVFSDSLVCENGDIISKGHNDIFVLRLTPEGKLDKVKRYGGKGTEKLTALSTDSLGNIYLSGNNEQELSADETVIAAKGKKQTGNSFVLQADSTLTAQWAKTYTSPSYAEITGLATDKQNNLLLSGNFNHNLLVDTLQYETNGLTDFFVARADTSGNVLWLKTFGGQYSDRINHLKLNKLGGAMIAGSFNDSLVLDTTVIKTKGHLANTFIAQYDTSGAVTWADMLKGEGGNMAKGGELDSKGNLYLMGSFKGSMQAGPDEITSLGDEDIFVARYFNCPPVDNAIQSPGYLCKGSQAHLYVDKGYQNIVWNDTLFDASVMTVSMPGTYHVSMVDKRGCVITDSVNIEEIPAFEFSLGTDTAILTNAQLELLGPDNFYAYEWQDGSIVQNILVYSDDDTPGHKKYELTVADSLGCRWSDDIDIEFYQDPEYADLGGGERLITIFPNPVKSHFYWTFETNAEVKMEIDILDASGKVIFHQNIGRYQPGQQMKADMDRFSAGAYYFKIISNGKHIAKKFVKN